MKVKIKKLHPDAVIPTYAHWGDACFDLTVTTFKIENDYQFLRKGFPLICSTGLAFEIPVNFVMLIFSRSGHGFNHGVRLANCVGIIDSSYRGEVKVKLTCDEPNIPLFKVGDRVAQAMIIPTTCIEFELVDQLSQTERGTSGFGGSGS